MVNNNTLRGQWLLVVGLCFSMLASAQQSQLKLVFTGDIMGHDTQIASALTTGEEGYDYRPCFNYIEPYLNSADLVIGNLEVTLAGPPYKGYPNSPVPMSWQMH